SFIACAEDIIWRLEEGIWEETPPSPKIAEENSQTPSGFELSQNFPNPFNPVTQISYTLPRDGHVRLEIYNLLGQKVATLVDEYQQAGQKTVNWEAKDLASGIYFYKLTSSGFTATKKMVLTK
ncbi:MAG: T9SS type A sorting domain-containing protein, partial [candidate division Zixibacteria bacterium]|nr:T9SS type A sorting domain-containing protein [candidate division Zixibacteria bacterium]